MGMRGEQGVPGGLSAEVHPANPERCLWLPDSRSAQDSAAGTSPGGAATPSAVLPGDPALPRSAAAPI